MRRKSHVGCGAGEKMEIASKSYLLLLILEEQSPGEEGLLSLTHSLSNTYG